MADDGRDGERDEVTADPRAAAAPFRIFINYRRDDAPFHVGRLRDTLRYGEPDLPGFADNQIFMDIDTIQPGEDFGEAIRRAVEQSDVFLTVIGAQWLTATGPSGGRRLDDPADFVRVEIESALQRAADHDDVRVIPTLVQGAEMPRREELPEALARLVHRHAVTLSDAHWSDDVSRLLTSLKNREREKLAQVEAERKRTEEKRADQKRAEREHAETERVAPEPTDRPEVTREPAAGEAAERAAPERATDEVRADEVEQRRGLGKGAIAGIVAFGAAAVLVAVILLSGSSGDGSPPSPSSVLNWTRASDSQLGGAGDQTLTSIVRAAGVLVAGGSDTSSGDRDAAVWTSPNGSTWQRAAGLKAPGDQAIGSVSAFQGGVLAVGVDNSQGDLDAALWQSSDGKQWESLGGRRVGGTDEHVNRLTNTPLGVVGAGWQTRNGDDDGAVWLFAPDGTVDPTAAPISTAALGGAGDQRISRVVPLGTDGTLVAVGYAAGDAGVWVTSQDLQGWTRVDAAALGGEGDQEMLDAATFPGGLVAVGVERKNGKTAGAVWLSEDGNHWTRVQDSDGSLSAGSPVQLNRVFARGSKDSRSLPALIAGGSSAGDAAVWTADDGRQWRREGTDVFALRGDQSVRSLRIDGNQVVAVGSSGPPQGRDAAVWIGSPP
jgi:hypothetical protein